MSESASLLKMLHEAGQSPETRRVAIVVYNPQFAEFQRRHDPLLMQMARMKAAHDRAKVRVEGGR